MGEMVQRSSRPNLGASNRPGQGEFSPGGCGAAASRREADPAPELAAHCASAMILLMTRPRDEETGRAYRLRSHASAILGEALRAVDPARLVAQALADDPELERWGHELAAGERALAQGGAGHVPGPGGRTVLVAVGKAALGMSRGALHILGDAVDAGLVLVPHGAVEDRPRWLLPQIALRCGGHPVPDAEGAAAAREVAALLDGLAPGDRLLVLLSGGGSSLLTLPREGLGLAALQAATEVLLRSGLSIRDMNRVRSALEELKGGGLARRAGGARILGLVLSDVVGDDPAVVASGPLTERAWAPREVEALLQRTGCWRDLPAEVRAVITRGDARADAPVTGAGGTEALVRVVGGGATAVDAAAAAARRLGYETRVLTTGLEGEARAAGRGLARAGMAVQDGLAPPPPPACLLAAGETTVRVSGPGKGGRNQEVALGAAGSLAGRQGILVAALGTDGVDGPTDAAGALADGTTVARAGEAGYDVAAALEANDAYPLLDALGDLIRTGPTGTNVADLLLVLVSDGRTAPPC